VCGFFNHHLVFLVCGIIFSINIPYQTSLPTPLRSFDPVRHKKSLKKQEKINLKKINLKIALKKSRTPKKTRWWLKLPHTAYQEKQGGGVY